MATKDVGSLRTRLSWEGEGAEKSLKGFRQDLQGLNSEMNVAKSHGKGYANSLKGLREQSDILTRRLKTQQTQVRELRRRYEESARTKGEDNDQTKRLLKSYNNATASMNRTEQQLKRVTGAIEEQTNPWKRLSRNAEKAADNLQNAGEKMSGFGQTLSTRVTAPIVGLGTLAVESTRELRENMARLETNARMAGAGVDVMNQAMRDLNAVTGETDSNVEALSNLMATGMNDNQLLQTIDALSGAVIKFPDTLKIEGLADGLQETLATGKAIGPFAELLERMGVDLETFDEGLAEATESGDGLNYALRQLNDLNLSQVNREFRETNKELVDGRNAQYDFMDSLSELGEKLEPIMTKTTELVTDVVEAFNELDEETQNNIIKFAGLAAVAGPVLMGLGGITSGVGKIISIGGKLSKLLGAAKGVGLVARIGALGVGGVAGVAVGGLAAVAGAVYYLTRDTDKLNEAGFETVNAMREEVEATDSLITEFEKLQAQNRLTSDEMLEYMDILDDLSSTASPDKIAELRDRQQELLEKSGFTNEEMEHFLDLNNQIIEQSPSTAEAISDQGNAYAEHLDSLKALNDEKREQMMMAAEQEILKGLRDEADLIEEQARLEQEKVDALETYQSKHDAYISTLREVNELAGKRRDLEVEMQGLIEMYGEDSEQVRAIAQEIAELSDEQIVLEKEKLDSAKEQLDNAEELLNTKEEDLTKVNEQLRKIDELKYEYEALWLAHLDINAEKGQGLNVIEQELALLDEQEKDLKTLHEQGKIVTSDYQEQKDAIEEQRNRLKEAKSELQQINDLAAETAYNKDVILNVSPSIASINRQIADTVHKRVTVGIDARMPQRLAYAEGTDHHPGGSFLAGEEGFELGKLGNRWEMLDFGMYDRPAGYQVFTHDESKQIIRALNNMPAYADGIHPSGEANRITNSLNNNMQDSNARVVYLLSDIANGIRQGNVIQIDGQTITQVVNENNAVNNTTNYF